MTDVPMKTPKTDFPVENSKTKQAAPDVERDASPVAPPVKQDIPPDPADDLTARFIMKLPVEDFKSLKIQRDFTEEGIKEATEAQAEMFRRQVVANMLQAAYNASWRAIQQKHGLPDAIDVDWADGSAYRKSNES